MIRFSLIFLCALFSARASDSALVVYGERRGPSADAAPSRNELTDPLIQSIAQAYMTGSRLKWAMPLPNPLSDMGLRPLGMPSPEGRFFEIRLNNPKRTRVIVVGTVHTVPVDVYMLRAIATNLVRGADYCVQEVNGVPLGSYEVSKPDESLLRGFVLPEGYPDILRESYRQWLETIGWADAEQRALMSDEKIKEYFDESGKWYPKAGLSKEILDEFEKGTEGIIKASGAELHPLYWQVTLDGGLPTCIPNPCGGIDDHINELARRYGKPVFSLEIEDDRMMSGFEEARETLAKAEGEDVYWKFRLAFNAVKKAFEDSQQEEPSVVKVSLCPTISQDASYFFHDRHTPQSLKSREDSDPCSTDVKERNKAWVERIRDHIMPESREANRYILMYVGEGHLLDLFARMAQGGMLSSVKVLSEEDLQDRFG